jgi:hypothetical protein
MTAGGRKIARDLQRSPTLRALKQHDWFRGAPAQVVNGFAELLIISRELHARIKNEGVIRADGTLHPAVEAFRKYKHTELGYLTAIADMRRAEHEQARDLVADMARAIEAPQAAGQDETPVAEEIEPSAAAPGVEPSASAPDEQAAFDFAAPADNDEAKR